MSNNSGLKTAMSLLFVGIIAMAAACGGDDGGDGDGDGDGDADAGVDAEINTCTILDPSYPDLGAKTGTALLIPQDEDEPQGLQFLRVQIPLNDDAAPDVLHIELWEDAPPYEPALGTGAVTILDDQADIIQCGACVFIAADVSGPIFDFHMASSGSVSIDTLDATPGTGQITGSITDVRLRKVEVGQGGQSVPSGGCKTEVAGASFDFTVDVMPAPMPLARSPRVELRRSRSLR